MSSVKKHRPFPGCEVLHNVESTFQPQEKKILFGGARGGGKLCKCICHVGYLSNRPRPLTCSHCKRVSQKQDLAIICANLCCSGLKSCKECEKCQEQEKQGWEGEFDDKKWFKKLYYAPNNPREGFDWFLTEDQSAEDTMYKIKSFIRQLLFQQKTEIREKIERLDYPEQFQDLTHFRNGYDFAIEDVLKLLEEAK